jgi:hypothetical protein
MKKEDEIIFHKWVKGMVLEISPDLKSFAFSPNIRLDLTSQTAPIKRNIYHISYENLDVASMLKVKTLYYEMYNPLFEILRKIRLAKIQLLDKLDETDIINPVEEKLKELENKQMELEGNALTIVERGNKLVFLDNRNVIKKKWSIIAGIYRGLMAQDMPTYFANNSLKGLITEESLESTKKSKAWDKSMTGNLNRTLIR